jgi:hypothetical protein
MGYRSEVAIAMKRDFFTKVIEIAPDATRELIKSADKFLTCGDSVFLSWGYIKWYTDGNDSVGSFYRAIQKCANRDKYSSDGYYLVEIGEDSDHNVTEGSFWDNPWNLGIIRQIHAEDYGKEASLSAFF